MINGEHPSTLLRRAVLLSQGLSSVVPAPSYKSPSLYLHVPFLYLHVRLNHTRCCLLEEQA